MYNIKHYLCMTKSNNQPPPAPAAPASRTAASAVDTAASAANRTAATTAAGVCSQCSEGEADLCEENAALATRIPPARLLDPPVATSPIVPPPLDAVARVCYLLIGRMSARRIPRGTGAYYDSTPAAVPTLPPRVAPLKKECGPESRGFWTSILQV